jgi:hypothetical protein
MARNIITNFLPLARARLEALWDEINYKLELYNEQSS